MIGPVIVSPVFETYAPNSARIEFPSAVSNRFGMRSFAPNPTDVLTVSVTRPVRDPPAKGRYAVSTFCTFPSVTSSFTAKEATVVCMGPVMTPPPFARNSVLPLVHSQSLKPSTLSVGPVLVLKYSMLVVALKRVLWRPSCKMPVDNICPLSMTVSST